MAMHRITLETLYESWLDTLLYESRRISPGNAGCLYHVYLPRQMTPCLQKRDDESTSIRGSAGVVDDLDYGLAHLQDINVTWGLI